MKQNFLFFLAALLMNVAATFAQSGTTGPLSWEINDGTLTISGNGNMPDYEDFFLNEPPWRKYKNSFSKVVISDGVTRIGRFAFFTHSIENVFLGNTITSIAFYAFCSTDLTSVVIPNSVVSIESWAFVGCHSLTSVTIGSAVSSIGSAFMDCDKISSIISYAEIAPICSSWVFDYLLSRNIPVTIPCNSYQSYINATCWNEFTNYLIDGEPTMGTTYYTAKCYTPYIDENFTTPINQPGTYYTSILSAKGCDSILCLTLLEKPVPQLCMISVDDNNHNEIIWEKQEEVVSYNIYREEMQTGNYQLVANISEDKPNIWVDMESNARIRSYRYKIAGVDTCGKESLLSLAHKTMHLVIYPGMGNSWNLIWTPYEGAHYSTYNIYRSSGENIGELKLIGTMPAGGNTSYTDFSAPEGFVYYMVEIIFDSPCILDKKLYAVKSNIATNKALAIEKNVEALNFTLYPNPTSGQLTIDNEQFTIRSVVIYDVLGKKQLSIVNCQLSFVKIDISHLSNGIYFIKIETENGTVNKKIIKN